MTKMTLSLYELQSNQDKGRFLIANECLDAQSHIMTCLCYSFSIMDSYKKRLCANCLLLSSASHNASHEFRCKECDQVYFCSLRCKRMFLRNGLDLNHECICLILRKLANYKCSNHEKSILKMIVFILYQKLMDESDNVPHDYSIEEEEEEILLDIHYLFIEQEKDQQEFIENAFIDECCKIPHWSEMNQLQSHYQEWSSLDAKEWLKPLKYLLSLLEGTILLPECQDPKLYLYDIISQIESNGFGLWKKNGNVCMGRILFPLASFFNVNHVFYILFILKAFL